MYKIYWRETNRVLAEFETKEEVLAYYEANKRLHEMSSRSSSLPFSFRLFRVEKVQDSPPSKA